MPSQERNQLHPASNSTSMPRKPPSTPSPPPLSSRQKVSPPLSLQAPAITRQAPAITWARIFIAALFSPFLSSLWMTLTTSAVRTTISIR